MRPPENSSGNSCRCYTHRQRSPTSFNEAAGKLQRKRQHGARPGGARQAASMRPPENSSGNTGEGWRLMLGDSVGFNEAAGKLQRKLVDPENVNTAEEIASMRPPENSSGNGWGLTRWFAGGYNASMRPPENSSGNASSPNTTPVSASLQ